MADNVSSCRRLKVDHQVLKKLPLRYLEVMLGVEYEKRLMEKGITDAGGKAVMRSLEELPRAVGQ